MILWRRDNVCREEIYAPLAQLVAALTTAIPSGAIPLHCYPFGRFLGIRNFSGPKNTGRGGGSGGGVGLGGTFSGRSHKIQQLVRSHGRFHQCDPQWDSQPAIAAAP